jgi:formylmethanofuran dehydrogenase subunit B
MILIDNKQSATFHIADVIIPSAITGIECGGLAFRLDHVPVELQKIISPPSRISSDEEILTELIKRITKH